MDDEVVPTQEQLQAEWDAQAASRSAEDNPSPQQADETPHQEEQEEVTAAPAAEPPKVDPLIEELRRGQADLVNQLKTTTGRVAALQSELAQAKKAAAPAAPGDAPTDAQIAAAAADPAEWKQLKEDFPDWGTAIEKFLDVKLAGLKPAAAPPAQEPVDPTAAIQKQIEQREIAYVERKHPGWEQLIKTPEFETWFKAQPKDVQDLADSPYSADAVDLFNRFKANPATAKVTSLQQQRGQRLAAAQTGKPGKTAPMKSVDDMTPQELWDHEAALQKARRQRA